jgi:hypothetical protein
MRWLWNRITAYFFRRRRQTFRFFDGQRWRRGDPFRIWRALENHDRLDMESMHQDVDAGVEPACTIAMEAICEVFEVERYNSETGRGMLDWELSNMLAMFIYYISDLKKKQSPGSMPSSPTGSECSTSPEPPEKTGNSSADSYSTPREQKSEPAIEPSAP